MAEFDCFLTQDEFADVLQAALDHGFRLCLKKNLLEPRHEYASDRETVCALLDAKQRAFFLERDDFTRCPVKLHPIKRDGVTMWSPQDLNGGPVIEAYFWGPFTKNGNNFIPCSLIAYGPKFRNLTTGHMEPVGKQIKDAYNLVVGPLKKTFKKVRSAKRVAYVSPGVQAMLATGWQLAGC